MQNDGNERTMSGEERSITRRHCLDRSASNPVRPARSAMNCLSHYLSKVAFSFKLSPHWPPLPHVFAPGLFSLRGSEGRSKRPFIEVDEPACHTTSNARLPGYHITRPSVLTLILSSPEEIYRPNTYENPFVGSESHFRLLNVSPSALICVMLS